MIIYFVLFAVLGLSAIFRPANKTIERYLFLLLVGMLIIVAVLRGKTVGMDVSNYEFIFNRISNMNIIDVIKNSDGSIVYDLYNKFVSIFFTSAHAITAINSILIISMIAYFIFKMCDNVLFGLFLYYSLYFYSYNLTAARQSLAIALCLISLCLLFDNKKILALICFVLSVGIHNSVVIAILYLFFYKINWNRKKLYLLFISSSVGMLFYSFFIKLFLLIFPRYNMYFSSGQFNFSDTGQGKKIFVSLFYLIILIILFLYEKELDKVEHKILVQTAAMIFAIVLGILFYNNLLISRIEVIFSIFSITFIPNVLKLIKNKMSKNIIIGTIVIFFSMPIFMMIFLAQVLSNINGIVPYISFW